MPRSPHPRLTALFAVFLVAAAASFMAGCRKPKPVLTYEIPTEVPEQLRPATRRMLAAMIPVEDNVWFFKVAGPEQAIERIGSEFRNFVQSVAFVAGQPELEKLPDGWKRGPEKPMRFATINIDTPEKQLDLSISSLPRIGSWDQQVVMNVNRWRGQLGLPVSTRARAGGEVIEVQATNDPSIWVDLTGKPPADASAMTAQRPASTRPSATPGGGPREVSIPQERPRLKYDRPPGWREGKMKSRIRLAAFEVGPPDARAEVTVIPAGGDVRGNVARWIGQLHSDPVPDETIDDALADAEKIRVDRRDAQRFILRGDPDGDAIDATIVPLEDDFSLFIKMIGPTETVQEQYDAMTSFLTSLEI
jgi:hypothetical protein